MIRRYVSLNCYVEVAMAATTYSLNHGYLQPSHYAENRLRQHLGMNPKYLPNAEPKLRLTLSDELIKEIEARGLALDDALLQAIA